MFSNNNFSLIFSRSFYYVLTMYTFIDYLFSLEMEGENYLRQERCQFHQ